MDNDISSRIKKAIENSGLTYQMLQDRTGIPKSALQRYATGDTAKLPVDRVKKIADVVGVSASYLMGWDNQDDVAANETEITKDKNNNLDTQPFTSLDDAMLFLIKSPVASAYGGYDLDKMSEEEIIDFANELSGIFKVIAERRKK